MKAIKQRLEPTIRLSESSDKKLVNFYQNDDWILIEKGQPLQDLIDYLTEVNKDHLTPQNTA